MPAHGCSRESFAQQLPLMSRRSSVNSGAGGSCLGVPSADGGPLTSNEVSDLRGANQSAAPITVLDVTGRSGELNRAAFTVAAHHRDDSKTR